VEQSGVRLIVWLVLGVGLLAAEIFMPGFVLFPFGVGALVAAATGLLGANLVVQCAVFVAVSGIGFVALRPLGRRLNQVGDQSDIGSNRYLGATATVILAIDDDDRGMVRVHGEDWRAETRDGSVLPAGSRVTVTEISGNRAVVAAAPIDTPEES
jgi:membrane protein implicated in regulation of membrane protease activity